MKRTTIIALAILVVVFSDTGCKKLVEVDGPSTNINSSNIYEKDVTAAAVLTSLYAKMSSDNFNSGMASSLTLLSGLSADEFKLNSTYTDRQFLAYYNNSLSSQTAGYEFWNTLYADLYTVNAALEGISFSETLTPSVKKQLMGECYFMRAFYFFYLVNLYGDVPLITRTDYKINKSLERTEKERVWEQIIGDLKNAQNLLQENYLDATLLKQTSDKVRPNKFTATALLARSYLFTKDWLNAEIQASAMINNPTYHLVSIDRVFLKNNPEAIWQFQPVTSKGYNTNEGNLFIIDLSIPSGALASRPVFLNPRLIDEFDAGDQRKTFWTKRTIVDGINYYFAYKYKIRYLGDPNAEVLEYSTVFRLAEQYLIRAEARIQLNKISEGISDLNVLRLRASDNTSADHLSPLSEQLSYEDALIAVEHERRSELFTEWGHRWLDLKRTGRIDAIMRLEVPIKTAGGHWKSNQQLYPIEARQIGLNPALVQNSGY